MALDGDPVSRDVITTPRLVGDMDEDWYHQDFGPVAEGSLSVSGAKKLLPPSCPAVFDYERSHPKPPTAQMEEGTIVHAMLLGTDARAVVLDYPNYSKKEAQQARDAARAAGRIPVLPHKYAELEAVAQAVLDDDECAGLLAEGDSEASMFWVDEEAGIWCRGRIDRLTHFDGLPTIVDLKTAASSAPDKFAKSVDEYCYYMQSEWYREGLAALLGCDRDDVDFVFVVVPTEPPYLPMAYRLEDPRDIAIGRQRNAIAREKYADCAAVNAWPKWSSDIHPLSLPGYARNRIGSEILRAYDY